MSRQQHEHVAIFISSMEGGGAQRAMMNLTCELAARGYCVDLILARSGGPYLADVPASVRVVELNCKRLLTSLFPLVRYLRSERPFAMLSCLDYVNIIALWARRLAGVSTRLVVNEQNTLSRAAVGASKWRNRFTPFLARHFYPWADSIVAVSEDVRTDLLEVLKIAPQRVKVIYNSVVRREIVVKSQAPIEHPWFQAKELPVLVAVGRLYQQKDYPTLIRAFARLRKFRKARLVILGEGAQREEIERMIVAFELVEDVQLMGFVENPFPYMSRASLFVLSSQWEGLPLVLIEALCCGVPVVATDCPSGPREILHKPTFGRLVPVGDVEALSKAMIEALSEKQISPPEQSWQPFEISSITDHYVDLFLKR